MDRTVNNGQEITIEESLKELDGIVEKLESRDISLKNPLPCIRKAWNF